MADDFIAYAKGLEKFPVAESANFILIAATLVLIKSKSLLPELDLTEEEKAGAAELERRLKNLSTDAPARAVKLAGCSARSIFANTARASAGFFAG